MANGIIAALRRLTLPEMLVGGSHLLLGNVLGAVIGLASFALTARVLTPSEFGLLTLVVTGVTLVGKFLGFQSWQAVVRFGSARMVESDSAGLAAVVRCGIILDVAAAALAGLLSLVLGYAGSRAFGWEPQVFPMIAIYSVTLFSAFTGTATGVLRIADRFDMLALHVALTALVKLAVVVPLFLREADLLQFLIGWAFAQVLSNLLLLLLGIRQLEPLGIARAVVGGATGTRSAFLEMRGFFFVTNIDGGVRVVRDLDVPLIGAILGTEGVGIYKVGRQLTGVLQRVVDPFYAAVYPYLARAVPKGDFEAFRRTMRISAIGVGCFCVVGFGIFWVIGYDLIRLLFSESYVPAFGVAVWCLAGAVVWGFVHPLGPGLLALGLAGRLLAINVILTAGYLVLTAGMAMEFGVTGAAIAYLVFFVSWAVTLLLIMRRKLASLRWAPMGVKEELSG